MVLRRHVLWSLLAALLLCTLAAANSLPIPATSVPTSTSIRAVDSASRLSVGGGHSAGVIFTLANRAPEERSGQLAGLLAAGRLEIPIAKVYPLAAVRDAYRELEQRHTRGKIVLVP